MEASEARMPAVIIPAGVSPPGFGESFARRVTESGFRRLWVGQSLGVEPHHVHVRLAGAGFRLATGNAVTLAQLRSPLEAAIQARSVAALTGQPFVAGFGAGTPEFTEYVRGVRFASPTTFMEEYLTAVRGLLNEGHVRLAGRYHNIDFGLGRMEHAPVEVGGAVLRPGMARVVGRAGDVAITWMTPPRYVADVLVPSLALGAEQAGRAQRPRVATVVHAALEREGRDPYRLAELAASGHLAQPHYAAMLRDAGVPVDPADPEAGARALVNLGVYVFGSAADVAAALAQHYASGVDEVVLNCCGVLLAEGEDAVMADLAEIAEAVRVGSR